MSQIVPQAIIAKKRDGIALSKQDIEQFATGLVQGQFTEPQAAALAMAIFLNGMETSETVNLTMAMRDSGDVLDWSGFNLPGPIVDKHSTGGVGDKVSIVLGPMLAACGCVVPMIAGRGLGHTGGTVDKLEGIPGYCVDMPLPEFQQKVLDIGVGIIGQTADIAPADRKLYALRDVSGCVESIPLITSSILSKKLAEGLDVLVMDVKYGSGAFMQEKTKAQALADAIESIGNSAGTKTKSLLTDMNEVLGHSAGHHLEIIECIDYLTGDYRCPRLHKITMDLAIEALVMAGLATDATTAEQQLHQALDSGQALVIFNDMVAAFGGPADLSDTYKKHLPQASFVKPLLSPKAGTFQSINVYEVGMTLLELGAGRLSLQDKIDHRVGLSDFIALHSKVEEGQALVTIHAASEAAWQKARARLLKNMSIS